MTLQSSFGDLGCVIVTRNRFQLLQRCLHGLLNQTRLPETLIVVDNGSADDTSSLFQTGPFSADPRIDYVRLEGNSGGAGGFHTGIARAMEQGCDWIFVMDDDGCPAPDALERLMAVDPNPAAIHAAAALVDSGDPREFVWPAALVAGDDKDKILMRVDELTGPVVPVVNAPFIGMLFHRTLIERIGLPEKDFFVSFEDGEMCARAWARASGVRLVPSAVVRHPRIERRCFQVGRRKFCVIALAPWRRYYDTRNRLVIAKWHFGHWLWTEALPGTLLRWLMTLAVQPNRRAQSAAFARGIFDGLTGRLGMRWAPP
ncbi:glycosyltransferase family 2 protein [Thiocystis violascens]|uniref:Putative glycosyltransferase n=1 Tax=Thiocystis violascens (strain ATCC 17096 / DSM 198 / 6111) TaxID=765911 RepID=I3Y5D9_THIV6|nr:glycosyltransferase family 2 protein [Thiocystis violascens]AFL72207.1 putative glycosyltransferase [Thiocystis violascens DSM 198]